MRNEKIEKYLDYFEERAGIMEYDGNLNRVLAESRAYFETVRKIGSDNRDIEEINQLKTQLKHKVKNESETR